MTILYFSTLYNCNPIGANKSIFRIKIISYFPLQIEHKRINHHSLRTLFSSSTTFSFPFWMPILLSARHFAVRKLTQNANDSLMILRTNEKARLAHTKSLVMTDGWVGGVTLLSADLRASAFQLQSWRRECAVRVKDGTPGAMLHKLINRWSAAVASTAVFFSFAHRKRVTGVAASLLRSHTAGNMWGGHLHMLGERSEQLSIFLNAPSLRRLVCPTSAFPQALLHIHLCRVKMRHSSLMREQISLDKGWLAWWLSGRW